MGYCWNGAGRDRVLQHREVYSKAKGIPLSAMRGKVILHSCDNRACINPDHMTLGTQRENMEDAARKGRVRGTPRRFTPAQVRGIRRLQGRRTAYAAAKTYQCSVGSIQAIWQRRSYKDVKD